MIMIIYFPYSVGIGEIHHQFVACCLNMALNATASRKLRNSVEGILGIIKVKKKKKIFGNILGMSKTITGPTM